MLVNKYADELPYISAYLIKGVAVSRYNFLCNLSLAQCLYGTSLKVELFGMLRNASCNLYILAT